MAEYRSVGRRGRPKRTVDPRSSWKDKRALPRTPESLITDDQDDRPVHERSDRWGGPESAFERVTLADLPWF